MKGILHIKLFEYLIEKDNAFGYVQIKDFLLEHIPELDKQNDRLRMKRFLDFMESENYIEKMSGKQRGIWITQEAGRIIPRNEISSVVRIKPKAVDLYNSYVYNDNNLSGVKKTIIVSGVAVLISAIGLFLPIKKETIKDEIWIKKYDSISNVNQNLKNQYYQLQLKTQELKKQYKDTL